MRKRRREHGRIEMVAEEFAKEMKAAASHFNRKADVTHDWWKKTFGVLGPLVSAIMSAIFLMLCIIALRFFNIYTSSQFVSAAHGFILGNFHIFFLAALLFNYAEYFSELQPKTYAVISPVVSAMMVVFVVWVLVSLFSAMNVFVENGFIESVISFVHSNLPGIFAVVIVLGYAMIFIRKFVLEFVP